MIHNYNIPIQVPPQALHQSVARPQANTGTVDGANRSLFEEFPAAPFSRAGAATAQNLTADRSSIDDLEQAAAATQHARLLMQAQPSLALAAQANSSSQSVARLLQ